MKDIEIKTLLTASILFLVGYAITSSDNFLLFSMASTILMRIAIMEDRVKKRDK